MSLLKDQTKFFKFKKNLEPYLVKFQEDDSIKAKIYLDDCQVRREN